MLNDPLRVFYVRHIDPSTAAWAIDEYRFSKHQAFKVETLPEEETQCLFYLFNTSTSVDNDYTMWTIMTHCEEEKNEVRGRYRGLLSTRDKDAGALYDEIKMIIKSVAEETLETTTCPIFKVKVERYDRRAS